MDHFYKRTIIEAISGDILSTFTYKWVSAKVGLYISQKVK